MRQGVALCTECSGTDPPSQYQTRLHVKEHCMSACAGRRAGLSYRQSTSSLCSRACADTPSHLHCTCRRMVLHAKAHLASRLQWHRPPCRQPGTAACHDTMVQAGVPAARAPSHCRSVHPYCAAGSADRIIMRGIHCAHRRPIKLPLCNAYRHPHPQGPLLGADAWELPIGWQPSSGVPAVALPAHTC